MSQLDSFLFLKADDEDVVDGIRATKEVVSAADGFESGVDYIRVTIVDRNLQKTMPWVTRYPAVHFRAHSGDELDFNTFLAPEFLSDVGAQDMHRVYQNDQTALGPIAYKSGLQLEFGLFGATSSDALGTALGIFQELSQFSSSAFVSEALPFSGILKRSIDMAVGSGDDMKLNVGFKGNVSSLPGPGTYALVFKGKRQIRPDTIYMNSHSSLVYEKGNTFRGAPYIVFKVEQLTWRDDWELIPELREPWENVRAAGRANNFQEFEAAIGIFKRACILSRDLCRDQIDQLRKFADEILFDAKETFNSSFESSGDFALDTDPGSMSAAFHDVYEVKTDSDEEFESFATSAPKFITRGAAKIFKRKMRGWQSRRSASEDPTPAAKSNSEPSQPAHKFEPPAGFKRGMEFVLKWEGGFVDDPDDPGGRTNKGVTQKTYDSWRAKKGLLAEDVLHITDDEVHAIYFEDYWNKVAQSWYPDTLAIALFDSAVNMGPKRAVSMLQLAINETRNGPKISVDGAAGQQTFAALRDCFAAGADRTLLDAYIKARRGVYHRIVDNRPRSAKFLNGWLNRLNSLASFIGASDNAFESVGGDVEPHPTKRIQDLGSDDPLEKPLFDPPRTSTMFSSGNFEAVTSISADELAADADDILALDDREERHANALELIFDALDAPWQSREANVKAVLKKIRQGRDFDLLHVAATEAEREGTARNLARTFRAQALIELGLIDEAIITLEDALDDRPNQYVQMEVRGLLGRAFKSAYFLSLEEGEPNLEALAESIHWYHSTFKEFRGEALWHAVNALALLKRTDSDRNPLEPSISREELAKSIIALGIERINTLPDNETIWDRASVAEAHIALGDWSGVETHLAEYISRTDEKFNLGSTLRQFKEVWQLDSPGAPPEARKIVAELHSALAATPGAEFELTADDMEAIEELAANGEAAAGPVTEAFQSADGAFESIVDGEKVRTFRWAENLANIGRSIARVDSNRHNPKGTAFLIRGEELFGEQARGRHFVMTNEHVVNAEGRAPGIMPQSTLLTFTRFPNSPPCRVINLIWSSPREHHDTTILEITPPPEGTIPLSTASMPMLAEKKGDVRFVTVIGHPSGRELSLAINNLELMEHNGPGTDEEYRSVYMRYRSSTEPGNSGSPVFDWDTMELMGIHHKGYKNEGHVSFQNNSEEEASPDPRRKPVSKRRRRGAASRGRGYRKVKQPTEKRIKANQGIWLRSVMRAMQKNWPEPPQI